MRVVRMVVLTSLTLKVLVFGAWWMSPAAWAEKSEPAEAPATAEGPVPADLMRRSRGFRDLLTSVRQRAESLEQREQTVGVREAALKDLEKTVAEQVARLEALAKAPAEGAASGTAGGGPAVTKVYESMKAEEAAGILDRLDDATVTTILGRMREKKIGELLGAMNRERAVAVTKALAAAQYPPPQ